MEFNKSNIDCKKIYDFTMEDCVELGIKLNGVRLTDEKHIREIFVAILNNSPMISSIEVDINTMGVVDGQHRFEAYKRAWAQGYTGTMEVRFLDVPMDRYNNIVRDKNIHSKNWTIKDYKRAALLGGNEAMIKINEFCMNHRLLHGKVRNDGTAPTKDRYAMAFLKGGNVTKEIKNGTLQITDGDIKYAEQMYSEVERLLEELKIKNIANWFEQFVQAWYEIRRDYTLKERFDAIGMELYYSEVNKMDTTATASKFTWKKRFEDVLDLIEGQKKYFNNI